MGERVVIIDKTHPWYSHSGTVVAVPVIGNYNYKIKIDAGIECYARGNQFQKITGSSGTTH